MGEFEHMIGVFDSGHGGLTVMRELVRRFPHRDFVYLGDHGHAPYGDKTGEAILQHTRTACNTLFTMGCGMVIMACNTATAAAGRPLQQEWLHTAHPGKRLLGIIAPTVEAATQTPWSVKEPVFPQKFTTDTFALFATTTTVRSGVYETEIHKRCPRAQVAAQACPKLVPLLESGAPRAQVVEAVEEYVAKLLGSLPHVPEWAILGCTHYPLVADIFRAVLPPQTRLLDQPKVVANALEDYLERHMVPGERVPGEGHQGVRYFTTGQVDEVRRVAAMLVGEEVPFEALPKV